MSQTEPRARRSRSPAASELLVRAVSQLQERDPAPAYVQIERGVRMLVADGSLAVGQRLPAVRDLANRLNLATNTVARAYARLVDEGVVLARAGGGSVVADRQVAAAGELDQASRERMQRVVRQLVAYTLALGHSPAQVVHAVRAELAAFGRADAAQSVPTVQIRAELPSHAIPADVPPASAHAELSVSGSVARAVRLQPHDLASLPRAVLRQPFVCDEGWVVPSLSWSGVWLADVLALAEPLPAATSVHVGAGSYSAPLALAETSSALLAEALDGQPLALDHGAPWRLVLPGGACYTSVKWIDRLELVADPPATARA